MAAPPRPPTTAPAIGAPTVEPTMAPVPAPMAPPVRARSVGLLPQAAVIRPRDTIAATGMKDLNDMSCLLVSRLPAPAEFRNDVTPCGFGGSLRKNNTCPRDRHSHNACNIMWLLRQIRFAPSLAEPT